MVGHHPCKSACGLLFTPRGKSSPFSSAFRLLLLWMVQTLLQTLFSRRDTHSVLLSGSFSIRMSSLACHGQKAKHMVHFFRISSHCNSSFTKPEEDSKQRGENIWPCVDLIAQTLSHEFCSCIVYSSQTIRFLGVNDKSVW